MSALPKIRLEPPGIEALHMRPAQNEIRRRYGPRYHISKECLQDVAALWGIEPPGDCINDAGVFIPYRETRHRAGRCRAELRLARSPSGLWAMDTSHSTPNGGAGAAPSVCNQLAFLSELDAKAAGLHELIGKFRAIAAEGGSDAAEVRALIELLDEERAPQLTLF